MENQLNTTTDPQQDTTPNEASPCETCQNPCLTCEKTYTEADIENARNEAYLRGRNEVIAELQNRQVAFYRTIQEAGNRNPNKTTDAPDTIDFLSEPRGSIWNRL